MPEDSAHIEYSDVDLDEGRDAGLSNLRAQTVSVVENSKSSPMKKF